jgi:hypothetical protein
MGGAYHPAVRILGVTFQSSIQNSAITSWRKVTDAIKAQAKDMYGRELLLHQRILHANVYLLAKAWFLAQILPPPTDAIRQINTVLSWCVWKGSIFRVPLFTLQLHKTQEGWGLLHLEAKCRMLLLCRMDDQGRQQGTPTERWLTMWSLRRRGANPPYLDKRLARFAYLQMYGIDSAYISAQLPGESNRTYRHRVYDTLKVLLRDTPRGRELRVERKPSDVRWERVWRNLGEAPVEDGVKDVWCSVIHDIMPTPYACHLMTHARSATCRTPSHIVW